MSAENLKVPSQIFRWFERMKNNYEQSVQVVLKRFENYHEKQQQHIDQSNKAHINSLNQAHLNLSAIQNNQIEQLQNDVQYYRQQLSKQQAINEQLNSRYDAIMGGLLTEKRKDISIKEIFTENDFIEEQSTELLTKSEDHESNNNSSTSEENNEQHFSQCVPSQDNLDTENGEQLFDQAILQRQIGESEQAFVLFKQAAKQGHIKAMGAMGRSILLGEGKQEDQYIGVAWLINAANHNLSQAIDRVKHFQENDPELYLEALELTDQLA